jgi:hypothetical protein
MDLTKKKNPPNPNGNPNFKKRWSNFSDPVHVRIPPELHSLFKDLTTAISSGKIKITDLENMCIDWQNVDRQLTAITDSKPALTVVPERITETIQELKARADEYQEKYREKMKEFDFLAAQIKKNDQRESLDDALSEGLQLVDKFEQLQRKSWGTSPNQRGEFTTDSPRWQKFNEFKAWLAKSHD